MLDEALAAIRVAPGWAQAFLAFLALMLFVMTVGPRWTHRRVASRFAGLAAASGARVVPGADAFTESFDLERDGRRFTVRRELRHGSHGSYRGPRGHLLICETRLAGNRWELHGVNITEGGALSFLAGRSFTTGNAAFDGRFRVVQDGVPVRDKWLDGATRAAVTAFFDAAPASGALWVQAGLLQHVMVAPTGVEATSLAELARALSAVAHAFERTAGWRGPV